MKTILAASAAVVLALASLSRAATAQDGEWTQQFGTPGFDVARAIAVHRDAVYVYGAAAGALQGQTYAGGGSDVFLRKYDLAGNELWTRQYGTSEFDFPIGGAIGVDDTGIYVGGQTDGSLPGYVNAGSFDMFVQRFDLDGNEIWTRQFGSPGDDFSDGLSVGRGRVVVAGAVSAALPGQSHGGSWDAFVRAYDLDGNELWTRQFGSSGSEDLHAVAVDPAGARIYAAGSITTLPDFAGDEDALAVAYDLDGNQVWSQQFGAVENGRGAHAAGIAAGQGRVYVTGMTGGSLPGQTSAGGVDAFLRTFDADGNELWTRQFGTLGNDSVDAGGTATDGRGVFVSGRVGRALPGQISAGSSDAFVRRYDRDGNELLTVQFGTAGADNAPALAVDDVAIYIGGRVGGALAGQTSAGGSDAFVLRLLKAE